MYKSSKRPIKENNFNPLKDIEPKYFGVATTKVYNENMCDFIRELEKLNSQQYDIQIFMVHMIV